MPLDTTPVAAPSTAQPDITPSSVPAAAGPAPSAGQQQGAGAATQPGTSAVGSSVDTSSASQAQQAATVRDVLRGLGLDLGGHFQDDHSVLQHLAGVYRQANDQRPLVAAGQQYLQHADKFQIYLQKQQEDARRQQQEQQAEWWKAPTYDPSWASKLSRDPQTGELRVLPGNDPAIIQKYQAWSEHQRSFVDKFSQDPIAAIKPGIEQVAQEVAQRLIQQHLGGYQEQQSAQQILSQHSSWLVEHNPQGEMIRDQRGTPVLSEWGQRYNGYVQQAEGLGIRSAKQQNDYALGFVQRDYLLSRMNTQPQTQTAQDQGQQAKQDFLARASATHTPNVGSQHAAGANGAPVNPPALTTQRALMDQMLRNMQAAGIMPGQKL